MVPKNLVTFFLGSLDFVEVYVFSRKPGHLLKNVIFIKILGRSTTIPHFVKIAKIWFLYDKVSPIKNQTVWPLLHFQGFN